MEKIHNKLVRDNIPDIIKEDQRMPITKILNEEDYKQELEKKLLEEYHEVLNSNTPNERAEELADMLEIMISLAKLENKTLNDIIEIANKKKEKNGGFEKRIYLEKVISKD